MTENRATGFLIGSLRPSRVAWLVLAAAATAFAVFEAVKHDGWALAAGVLGLLLPLAAARVAPAAAARLLLHPVPPMLLLVALAVGPWTNVQVAPTFTAGLAWLAYVAARRGLSEGARTRISREHG